MYHATHQVQLKDLSSDNLRRGITSCINHFIFGCGNYVLHSKAGTRNLPLIFSEPWIDYGYSPTPKKLIRRKLDGTRMYEAPWRKPNVVEPEPNISPFLNTFTSLPRKLVICFFSRSTAQAKTCLKTPYTPLKLFLFFALINSKYCQLNQIKC